MRLLRRLARLALITTLLGSTAALVAATSPAASAAPATGPDGWIRIAHLSPKAPAMDMYLYPFANPGQPIVLKDVRYGGFCARIMARAAATPRPTPVMLTSRNSTGAPGAASPNSVTRNEYWDASAASVASRRVSTSPARSCAAPGLVSRMREFRSSWDPAALRAARSARSAAR